MCIQPRPLPRTPDSYPAANSVLLLQCLKGISKTSLNRCAHLPSVFTISAEENSTSLSCSGNWNWQFNSCKQLWNHHHIRDLEKHIHKRFLVFFSSPFFPSSPALCHLPPGKLYLVFFLYKLVCISYTWDFFSLYMRFIKHFISLTSCTQHNDFEIHSYHVY